MNIIFAVVSCSISNFTKTPSKQMMLSTSRKYKNKIERRRKKNTKLSVFLVIRLLRSVIAYALFFASWINFFLLWFFILFRDIFFFFFLEGWWFIPARMHKMVNENEIDIQYSSAIHYRICNTHWPDSYSKFSFRILHSIYIDFMYFFFSTLFLQLIAIETSIRRRKKRILFCTVIGMTWSKNLIINVINFNTIKKE